MKLSNETIAQLNTSLQELYNKETAPQLTIKMKDRPIKWLKYS